MTPDRSPFELSTAAWIGGGFIGTVAGAAGKKDHRILGAIGGGLLGAILFGAFTDVLIERYYVPQWRARHPAIVPAAR